MVGGRRGRHAPPPDGALALLRPWMGVLHVMIHGGGASALHLMCTAAISCIVVVCSAVWGLVCDGSARGGAVRVQRKNRIPPTLFHLWCWPLPMFPQRASKLLPLPACKDHLHRNLLVSVR